ncbi:hypothetical protein CC80DRAFT_119073 [Byssothecium circinans]|uniref:Uncharacterized protein n=1 Tax=Byssothecium circinans TaxID=147558 RepID=A0A6A5TPC9_9PLEO|nr:hypothetical protein CC80DRAFT_119073 [Byssothecium circinans]
MPSLLPRLLLASTAAAKHHQLRFCVSLLSLHDRRGGPEMKDDPGACLPIIRHQLSHPRFPCRLGSHHPNTNLATALSLPLPNAVTTDMAPISRDIPTSALVLS